MIEGIEFVAVVDEEETNIQLMHDADLDTYEVRNGGLLLFSGDFAVLVGVIQRALELWHTESI